MEQIASVVNQESTAPASGGTEWSLWLQYINRGVAEWAGANDWEELRKVFYPSITGMSLASVSMPLDFKKLAAPVKLYNGEISTGIDYPEIMPEQEGLYDADDDKYLRIYGNTALGFTLVFNQGTLASGASICVQYYSMPTSLASPAEYAPLADPQFLVDRTVAYIFEARSDSRFQLEENKARDRLLAMVEGHEIQKYNSYSNPNYVITTLQKTGFRVGRD